VIINRAFDSPLQSKASISLTTSWGKIAAVSVTPCGEIRQ
jgi:hypothetical protein